MTLTSDSLNWIEAGTRSSVDALVLRFAAVMNGAVAYIGSRDTSWLLVDHSGRIVDCGSDDAAPLLGAPVSRIVGGIAASELEAAWNHVLMGRSQTVWPWQGGRAKAATRSIELHPLRDLLSDDHTVIGALVIMVDGQSQLGTLPIAA